MKENGTTYLLESSGLRFKRVKADGTVDYTVYGFNREPLAQFEISAPGGTAPLTTQKTLTASKTSSKTSTQALTSGTTEPAGAYILQPSGPITVGTGQVISFQGDTDFGTSFTWAFGDGATTSGLTASHAFTAVGTYTVSFKASASGYTSSTATRTITVMAKPSITSFTASPSSITSGQSSTLAWTTSGATSLSLDNGIGSVTGTTSKSVTLSVSTAYTLTATNAAGSVTATMTVAVSAPAPPTIVSFTATPATIAVGGSTSLAWNVTGGAAISISDLGGQSGTSVAVSPATTTSYTLTATNAAGSATATITVTVETQLPVITDFWANPYQVTPSQSSTLNWAASQADSLKLDNVSAGTSFGTMTGTTYAVNPSTTTTYKLTATNLVGSVSATVTVSVGTTGSLAWKKTMVYGFGQELAEDQPGMGTTFIQSDFVGSPSVMTDASGTVIGRSKNLPFGERMSSWGQKTIRRYTNHEDDSDSGAIYMQAREQLPAYGKFAQVDPAYDQTKDDPESWNLYTYVTNNPVTHTDPDGRILSQPIAPVPVTHIFDFETDTFDDEWLFIKESAGGASGGSGTKSREASEATDPPSGDDPQEGTGDQGGDGGTGSSTSGPSKPKEATAPDPKTQSAQTVVNPSGPQANPLDIAPVNPVTGEPGISTGPRTGDPTPGSIRANKSNPWIGEQGFSRIGPGGKPKYHAGDDINAAVGTNALAILPGRVAAVGFSKDAGNYIDINHGGGLVSREAHLKSKPTLAVGTDVTRGQIIGITGRTGNTAGQPTREDHVHLNLRYFSQGRVFQINPAMFLNWRSPSMEFYVEHTEQR